LEERERLDNNWTDHSAEQKDTIDGLTNENRVLHMDLKDLED